MIILKVTKSQGFNLSLEDTFLEKPKETPSLLRVKRKIYMKIAHTLLLVIITTMCVPKVSFKHFNSLKS